MGSIFARGNRLYAKAKDVNGKWQQINTGLPVGAEAEAERWLADRERVVERERRRSTPTGPLTVESYARSWLDRRKTKTVNDDRARIENHAMPRIGHLPLADVRPRHLRDLIMELRDAGELAPKTIRQVSGVLHTMFKSAVIEELIPTNPVVFERGVLPKLVDKDPTWRAQAIFTRAEVEQILSDARLPFDRRVLYALKFFTGRHSEVADLTWSQYDDRTKPLGSLHLAYTKQGVPRSVPVHPTLAKILKAWREHGYRATYGRDPERGDLVVTTRAGRRRKADEAQKQFRKDLEKIGLRTSAGKTRHRRGHDLRRTLITLARADGASDHLLRWVTHGPKPSEILDTYSTPPWDALCGAIEKLRVRFLGAGLVQSRKAVSASKVRKRPRRDSNAAPELSSAAPCQSILELAPIGWQWDSTEHVPLHQALVQAGCDLGLAALRASSPAR